MSFVPYLFTPPTHGSSPSPAMRNVGGYSCLSHSSRAAWKSQKNIVFAIKTTTASGIAKTTQDQKLSVSYESSKGGPKMFEELSEWEVVGCGNYGPLEDWMVETDFGIEDTSGETIMLSLVQIFNIGDVISISYMTFHQVIFVQARYLIQSIKNIET